MNENFASALGCTDVRILRGHYGDEALNHIDMFFTFASATDLVFGVSEATDPRNQVVDAENRARLADLVASGALRLHDVPMPTQCERARDHPASCADSQRRVLRTFLNGVFFADPSGETSGRTYLMPVYDVPSDKYYAQEHAAVAVFAELGWKVDRVSSDLLIQHNGAFHCITRNVPRLDECMRNDCPGTCAEGPGLGERTCVDSLSSEPSQSPPLLPPSPPDSFRASSAENVEESHDGLTVAGSTACVFLLGILGPQLN